VPCAISSKRPYLTWKTSCHSTAAPGKVLLSTGQLDRAVEHLHHAVAVDPLDAQTHYRVSQAYRQLGRISKADREVATFQHLREAEERLRSAYGDTD